MTLLTESYFLSQDKADQSDLPRVERSLWIIPVCHPKRCAFAVNIR